ncbi:MAG: acetoacetyl-CoA reductase [Gammaproteobacteria bacterium]|nr:acetoacetyl-CoA reductase [Gammaproteobacteria bacterium]
MEVSLKDRVALVTGGTRGIGAAIVKQFAASGARVVTNYRNQEQAEKFQAEMKKAGYDIHIYQADVSDFEACKKLIADVEKDVGPLDILVNNAGVTQDTTLRKMTKEQWDTVLRINLDSVYNVSRNIIEGMLERGYGRIINISSINGQKGQVGQSNYAAAKAGMHGFTMALAQETRAQGYYSEHGFTRLYCHRHGRWQVPEDVREKIIAQIPVARLGTPEEIAELVTYVASDKAGFITGADISANGGQHMM